MVCYDLHQSSLTLLFGGKTWDCLHQQQLGLQFLAHSQLHADLPLLCLPSQLSAVTYLSLTDCGLRKLAPEPLAALRSLSTLVLSFNELTSLEGLEGLGTHGCLTSLDASHNMLSRLEAGPLKALGAGAGSSGGASGSGGLVRLLLGHNRIAQLTDLDLLKRYVATHGTACCGLACHRY